ncbi:choline-binding transcriptional repressor BetI [Paracoccus luteus]|uniref:choline-binding transcriptional repressor BetI n=1 Tax=Paracoccus luteus TaxID=2508543 RepID=UPI0010703171|nr:transcriptional regulator BetI [Paracoccus luteus]
MHKAGAEPIRKAALINAAIAVVGRAGSLDVTVAQIARHAGMSPALAHHYFGSKTQMFLAAMRHILSRYAEGVRAGLAQAGPDGRALAIVRASFSGGNFERDAVAAWLNFYALALTDPQAARLLAVYHRRLRSNLVHALRPRLGDRAVPVAATLGALIDGVYLRAVLEQRSDPDPDRATALVADYLNEVLA